jgi:hypothetical protein
MKIVNMSLVMLAVLSIASSVHARKAMLSPAKVTAIVSPSDARDSRILLFFELPSDVMNPKARVDFATLICKAQMLDADMGQIDVFPVAAEWKNEGAVSWSNPWKEPGGDYKADFLPNIYSLKSEFGLKEITINVTEIVEKWQRGEIANSGMMLKLSADDLENMPNIKYAFEQEGVLLKVLYSYEYR